MQESKRDKLLRYLLIGICLLVVLRGFLYSSTSEKAGEMKPAIHAEVLSRGDEHHNPVIAVAKMVEEQPVLVIYEIDQKNQYYFKVLHSVSLHNPVKMLGVTKEQNGIWVQLEEKKWILFSESLEVLQERDSAPDSVISSRQSFHIQEDTGFISIPQGAVDVQLDLTDKSGEPKEIHSLSGDDSVWLVVFQKEMVLARSR
ncbi:hypothetical protein [Rossellomorea vietnamensis]|uniref:Uncharacterized protein n=1 Tax=Rossellomorea vietnamensis TaxID=218284 RepID=A0A0P6WS14_9BACI|nr:hypothetical protein [Rossellomorea vietnamensis]KPL59175.1 hypothetical protein AM506_13380 [Rossellomorea vietnamensis]